MTDHKEKGRYVTIGTLGALVIILVYLLSFLDIHLVCLAILGALGLTLMLYALCRILSGILDWLHGHSPEENENNPDPNHPTPPPN